MSISRLNAIVDLHIGNFGCSVPGLNKCSKLDLLGHLGNPECVPILPVKLMNQTASLPHYLVMPISMARYLSEEIATLEVEQPTLKVLDFGSGPLLFMISARSFGLP
jgi:hypothetical protein